LFNIINFFIFTLLIQPYKQWVIVIFIETNDYSVIPVNWLISQTEVTIFNILSVQYCRWPSFNITNNELLRADDLWNSFKIKMLDGKIYCKYIFRTFYIIVIHFIRFG